MPQALLFPNEITKGSRTALRIHTRANKHSLFTPYHLQPTFLVMPIAKEIGGPDLQIQVYSIGRDHQPGDTVRGRVWVFDLCFSLGRGSSRILPANSEIIAFDGRHPQSRRWSRLTYDCRGESK